MRERNDVAVAQGPRGVRDQLIVLGGSVLKAGAPLLAPMRRSMLASSWKAARRGLRIVPPALGDDVGLIGAVEFARLRAGHARSA